MSDPQHTRTASARSGAGRFSRAPYFRTQRRALCAVGDTLSVACGDSSPKGRAPCGALRPTPQGWPRSELPLWGSWHGGAVTERAHRSTPPAPCAERRRGSEPSKDGMAEAMPSFCVMLLRAVRSVDHLPMTSPGLLAEFALDQAASKAFQSRISSIFVQTSYLVLSVFVFIVYSWELVASWTSS